ncbi:hypothetical protein ACJJIQ_00055 (plasmid) [Microbulbifer sp. ANSA003]|uniref:hypothetical protein n=1 Tax=unclassified Microbulbifer TaxID=2619833 RepID=UPI00403A5D28
MTEPTVMIAGDSISWSRTLTDYLPEDGWTLTYRLVSVGKSYVINTTADGSAHQVALTSADTAAWLDGEYSLVAWVENGTDRYTIGSLRVRIKPDPTSADYDPRSHAEKMLEALRELLQKKAGSGKQAVTVDGQTVTFNTWDEMVQAEKYYTGKVKAQRRRARDKRTGRKSNRVLAKVR